VWGFEFTTKAATLQGGFSTWQEEGRREAPRQGLQRAPRLRVVDRLLRSLGNLDRAAAGAVEAAAASVYVERVYGALSRLVSPPPPPLHPRALLRQNEGG
jgi:hypothetical protein